jgi:hypothetical protein
MGLRRVRDGPLRCDASGVQLLTLIPSLRGRVIGP